MDNEIISYMEMCQREGASLQRGMNFQLNPNHSVILMSIQKNAPYEDQVIDDGTTIIYEGHDVPKTVNSPNPKTVDQQERLPSGKLTENGKFFGLQLILKIVEETLREFVFMKKSNKEYGHIMVFST